MARESNNGDNSSGVEFRVVCLTERVCKLAETIEGFIQRQEEFKDKVLATQGGLQAKQEIMISLLVDGQSQGHIKDTCGTVDEGCALRELEATRGIATDDLLEVKPKHVVSLDSTSEALPLEQDEDTQDLEAPEAIVDQAIRRTVRPGHKEVYNAEDIFREMIGNAGDADATDLYRAIVQQHVTSPTMHHQLLHRFGCGDAIRDGQPDTPLSRITESGMFVSIVVVLILANAALMGYEVDVSTRNILNEENKAHPGWIGVVNVAFTIAFVAELFLRLLALRSWFFVSPEWAWNTFDVLIVACSIASDALDGANLSFLRAARLLRAVRVVRIIRIVKFFRELRVMLLSITACLASLVWAFVFLALIIFTCSLFFLQGIVLALEDLPEGSEELLSLRGKLKEWYPDMPHAMFSLLVAATGGTDWLRVREPLNTAGTAHSIIFVVYIMFVNVGVMNVLTGVFLNSANEWKDQSLAIQAEEIKISGFVIDMLDLFKDLDIDHTGVLDYTSFKKVMGHLSMQAYLASHNVETTHVHLLYDLLVNQDTQTVDVFQFVLGILKLKGEAKAMDSRIIRREIGLLHALLKSEVSGREPNGAKGCLNEATSLTENS